MSNDSRPWWSPPPTISLFGSGFGIGLSSACVTQCISQPFIKMRLRQSLLNSVKDDPAELAQLKERFAEINKAGIRHYWNGTFANMVSTAPNVALQVGSFHAFRHLLAGDNNKQSVVTNLSAAALSGLVAHQFAFHPSFLPRVHFLKLRDEKNMLARMRMRVAWSFTENPLIYEHMLLRVVVMGGFFTLAPAAHKCAGQLEAELLRALAPAASPAPASASASSAPEPHPATRFASSFLLTSLLTRVSGALRVPFYNVTLAPEFRQYASKSSSGASSGNVMLSAVRGIVAREGVRKGLFKKFLTHNPAFFVYNGVLWGFIDALQARFLPQTDKQEEL